LNIAWVGANWSDAAMSKMVSGFLAIALTSLITSSRAEEPPIASSLKRLAGLYGGSYELAQIRSENISIGPDGSFTLKMPMGMYERGFIHGKITYFSPAGFVATAVGQKGPVVMKFAFQKGYPKSFFRDDGQAGVSAFTRQ
jgi:hypothetical protein